MNHIASGHVLFCYAIGYIATYVKMYRFFAVFFYSFDLKEKNRQKHFFMLI